MAVLDDAYEWLCHRRRDYPADADVWSFRRNWCEEKRRMQQVTDVERRRILCDERLGDKPSN